MVEIFHHPKHNNFYSLRKDSTGFFLAAILEGINPAIKVNPILIATKIIQATGDK